MESKILEKDNSTKKIKSENDINFKNIKTFENTFTSKGGYSNSFCIFKSKDNILSLICTNQANSIIYYDIIDNRIISEIKKAHNSYINNFIHFFDKKNKRDLIISISANNNTLMLWNINNLNCLLSIKSIYQRGSLFSTCFLFEINEIFILTSNCAFNEEAESVKVFDLKGNLIKTINESNVPTLFIDSYYDKKWDKNYIIICYKGGVKSIEYFRNKIYHQYKDKEDNMSHLCAIIQENGNNTNLIESCYDGNIRIWNFNNGDLLKKIRICFKQLYGICLWNKDYLLVGCIDKSIVLVDLNKEKIIKNIFGHEMRVVSVKKFNLPIYGECFISQGAEENQIKFWIKDKECLYKKN